MKTRNPRRNRRNHTRRFERRDTRRMLFSRLGFEILEDRRLLTLLHAVAWTDVNGNHQYDPNSDKLIAQIVDDGNGVLDTNDTIELGTMPTTFNDSTPRSAGYTTAPIAVAAVTSNQSNSIEVLGADGRAYQFYKLVGQVEQFIAYGGTGDYAIDYPAGNYDYMDANGEAFAPFSFQYTADSSDSSFLDIGFGVTVGGGGGGGDIELRIDFGTGAGVPSGNWNAIGTINTTTPNLIDFQTGAGTGISVTTSQMYADYPTFRMFGD